jgi:hypothetical protein
MIESPCDRAALVERLQQLLADEDARRFGLELFEDGIRREDDWWYVPISPNVPNVNAFDYAPVLNRIEEALEKEGTKLLLIPSETE